MRIMQQSADLNISQLLHSAWKGSVALLPLGIQNNPPPKHYCGVKVQGVSLGTRHHIGDLTYHPPPLSHKLLETNR